MPAKPIRLTSCSVAGGSPSLRDDRVGDPRQVTTREQVAERLTAVIQREKYRRVQFRPDPRLQPSLQRAAGTRMNSLLFPCVLLSGDSLPVQ